MGITFPSKSNMRLSLIAGVVVFGLCQAAPGGSSNLDMDEKQFEEFFHLEPVQDAKELKRRPSAQLWRWYLHQVPCWPRARPCHLCDWLWHRGWRRLLDHQEQLGSILGREGLC